MNNGLKIKGMRLTDICRFMMEEEYHPLYEHDHILFEIDENPATVEFEDGILTVRIYFTVEEETYNLFLEAGNITMTGTIGVKPVILSDRNTLMFSSEIMCDSMRELKKFLPRSIEHIRDALTIHRHEMKRLLQNSMLYKNLYTHDDEYDTSKKFCS